MKQTLISASKKAASHLMKNYGKIRMVRTKDQDSYFTNVDLESEKMIISEIQKKYPDHSIISEECGSVGKKSDYIWYIDPIDGTHNYINNFPLFGVSIGVSYKKQPLFGAIHLPYFNEFYFAEKGKGAFCNGKRLSVSVKRDAKKAFIVTDLTLRYNAKKKLRTLRKLQDNVYDMRALGCAVVAYTMVARGAADALFSTQMFPWDVAAGALIVEEAGGRVTNFAGRGWEPRKNTFLATNRKIHGQMLDILK